MRDKLVRKRIRLRGNATGNLVELCILGEGKQVGHRLANPGARLDGTHRRRGERRAHLLRHLHLARARLKRLIHPRRQTTRLKRGPDLIGRWRAGVRRKFVHVRSRRGGRRGEEPLALGGKRERCVRLRKRQVGEDGAVGPLNIRMHVRKRHEQPGRQVAQGTEDDAPHAGQGMYVVQGTVRDAGTSEGLRHVLELVRGEPRQGNPG